MFVGYFGIGLAAKRAAPRTSLGWLIAAPLLLLGWESVRIDPEATVVTPLDFVSYPISHSLLCVVGWALFVAGIYWAINRYTRGALAIGAGVISHWFLDLLVHRPDLPLYPGGAKVGLGLWHSVPATLVAEAAFFGAGVWLYTRMTTATSKSGQVSLWIFVAFLLLVYFGNLLGPPPERVEEIAYLTLTMWLLPFWAWSFDRRRIVA